MIRRLLPAAALFATLVVAFGFGSQRRGATGRGLSLIFLGSVLLVVLFSLMRAW